MTFWRSETWWLTVVADVAAVLAVALPGSARLLQAVAAGAAGIITAAYVHGTSAPAPSGAPPPSSGAPGGAVTASQVADVLAGAASSLRGGA